MRPLSRLQKVVIGVGACGGILYVGNYLTLRNRAYTSWTTNYVPSWCGKWDDNWDHRCPKSLTKTKRSESPADDNAINEELERNKGVATRHIIMIRHGQYNTGGKCDGDRVLTELGRRQAEWTGRRLKELQIPFGELVRSTMTRAQQTGQIIAGHLPDVPLRDCGLLEEGAPVPPEPPVGHWKPELYQFFQDGARIEAAFRQYFHRADCAQDKDSYTLLVCHANVIRYFVCRALQFPAEAWLRLSLNHASITWVSITPRGRVILRALGDSGHMPPEGVTAR